MTTRFVRWTLVLATAALLAVLASIAVLSPPLGELTSAVRDGAGAVRSAELGLSTLVEGRTTQNHAQVLVDDMADAALTAYRTAVELDAVEPAERDLRARALTGLTTGIDAVVEARESLAGGPGAPPVAEARDRLHGVADELDMLADRIADAAE